MKRIADLPRGVCRAILREPSCQEQASNPCQEQALLNSKNRALNCLGSFSSCSDEAKNKTLTLAPAKSPALTYAASAVAGRSKKKRFRVRLSHFSFTSRDLRLYYKRTLVTPHSHKASEEIKMELKQSTKKGQSSRSKARGRRASTEPRPSRCLGEQLSFVVKHVNKGGWAYNS